MSSVEFLREFLSERLSAAAEEIYRVVSKTIMEYEEEIRRQRKQLDLVRKPEMELRSTELSQHQIQVEEDIAATQRLCSRTQEQAERPQVKEEQDEVYTIQEGLKQESDAFVVTLVNGENDQSEAEPRRDQRLLTLNSSTAENQDRVGARGFPSFMTEDECSSLLTSEIEEASTGEESFMCDTDDIDTTATRTPFSATAIRPQARPTASGSGSSPLARDDGSWYYNFDVPWNKMPLSIRRVLNAEKRPSAAERREVIRIVAAEILTICKKPGKRRITEIARKMVISYPKSFQDELEGQIVGAGYDSLLKQLIHRIDNCRRLQASPAQKRLSKSDTHNSVKKARRDAYGCVNPNPELPTGETKEKQKNKQEELIKMFINKNKDAKKIERLMVETFPSQRKDILSAHKGTEGILKEWPFLSQEIGMRLHFRELTGVQIDDSFAESTATKFRRILQYFQGVQTEPSSRAGTILHQALAGGDASCAAILMLLIHFKEEEDKVLLYADDTARASDVDTTKLPHTPCIVVCGNSPLTAKIFMVAVDQVIVNEQLPSFTKAIQMMFCSYYLYNMDYPVELAATLEFLQRCIFRIDPDQGTKVTQKEKRRRYVYNPRVLSLISKIASLE